MAKDVLYPLRRLHGRLHEHKLYIKERNGLKAEYRRKIKAMKKAGNPFVFLVMTPEHGNLGDHAIALAETTWLNQLGISYIEITGKQLETLNRYDLLGIMNRYPILMQGGGYLGTLWYGSEVILRAILEKNPKSQIVFLPNTIYYEDSDWGREELQKSTDLYNSHPRLSIYAREKTSYDFMKPIYKDVRLVPDVVLSLTPEVPVKTRHGCLLCLRGDREKTRTEEQEIMIRQQVSELFGEAVSDTDMVTAPVSVEQRETALQEKFEQFAGAELVVTDRLHGMIFCAITGTPCIVVNSKSPKVRGCYEWIRDLSYIRFAEDISSIAEEYGKISKTEHRYDNSHLKHYYEELVQDIQQML